MDHASAAQAGTAAKLGADHLQMLADDPEQPRFARLVDANGFAIDLECDCHRRSLPRRLSRDFVGRLQTAHGDCPGEKFRLSTPATRNFAWAAAAQALFSFMCRR